MIRPAVRRGLHAATATLALLPWAMGRPAFRITVTALLVVAAILEAARMRVPSVRERLEALVPVYRSREATRISGGFWLAVGYAIAAWLPAASAAPAIAGIAVAALADPAASLAGSALARGPDKSWPGSLAAFSTAAAVLLVAGQSAAVVVAGALVGAAAERWSGPLDDNVIVAPAVTLVAIALA